MEHTMEMERMRLLYRNIDSMVRHFVQSHTVPTYESVRKYHALSQECEMVMRRARVLNMPVMVSDVTRIARAARRAAQAAIHAIEYPRWEQERILADEYRIRRRRELCHTIR